MAVNIDTLLNQMTIEEKVGQMTQVSIETITHYKGYYKPIRPLAIDKNRLEEAIIKYGVGSILNVGTQSHTPQRWYEIIKQIQDTAIQQTRLGIPVLYGIDSIHGASYTAGATLFPQQLALAATWNPTHAKTMGSISAYETKACSIPWTFSPVLDLGRNPVWPRLWETFGEDVHLSSVMGKAVTEGYQGEDISHPEKLAACLKHFTGYSMPRSGKDRTPAWIPERFLQEYHLPGFATSIDAGAKTIMINSGEINGIPVHASRYMLTDVLRDQLGFEGVAVTDWEDIQMLHTRHRVASSHKEAVRIAIEAGVDMSMVPFKYSFAKHLVELVKEGTISEERIDRSVRRILTLKQELGLFDTPYTNPNSYPKFASNEFEQANKAAADEAIVLLKNNNATLPLSKSAKVLVTGPTADSMQSLNGGWTYTWQGEKSDELLVHEQTVLRAIQAKIGIDNVTFIGGATFDTLTNPKEVVETASNCDYIIVCLGEASYTEYAGNIHDLNLESAQLELATTLQQQTNKPVILVLLEGRPRIIRTIEPQCDAILTGLLPGNKGGEAIADILFGDVNPSGKLPITYPRYCNDLVPYDHKFSDEVGPPPLKTQMYNPQFEFGHGLSYTTFEYSNLTLSHKKLSESETLVISVKITNLGKITGKETVQLYISDLYASITPPVKRLRGFQKIELLPNTSQVVTFEVNVSDLAFVGIDNQWITEKGEFKVTINNLEEYFEFI